MTTDPVTSQGDRDALIDAMAGYELDEGYSLSDAQAADLLDALLALPDTLLRVLLEARKPCERCEGGGWFGSTALDGKGAGLQEMTPCPTCHGSGSVPLVDRAQVLAALGMGGVVQENDDLHADLVKCLEVRGLALEEAATFVQPGPDGQDYIDRARLIAQWIATAYERHAEGEVSGHKAWVETELARLEREGETP